MKYRSALLFAALGMNLLTGCQTANGPAAGPSDGPVVPLTAAEADQELMASETLVVAAADKAEDIENASDGTKSSTDLPQPSEASVTSEPAEQVSAACADNDCLFHQSAANDRDPHPAIADDLWHRMRPSFQLDLSMDNQRIKVQRDWYARHQGYLDRTARRASRYLHHVVEEVEKRGMPMEMALLPVVESAFDPFAYSHGRASGMWQFIPSTGRIFGLKQDWWYDGRRDIVASTDAALRYLQRLADRFDGDWMLALAAYNSGAGTVSKAIRRNKKKGKPTDFWSLKLPRETRAYVPKLIAISQIINKPEDYGVTLLPIEDKPYFEKVNIGSQIDIAQAANLSDISVEELYLLNPGFNRWATSPLGPHYLLVPVGKGDLFRERLASIPPEQRLTWQRYTIKSGDSLIKIARKFRTTPSVIKEVNNLRSDRIRQGRQLLIPVAAKGSDYYALSAQNRLTAKQNSMASSSRSRVEHRVKAGDTFWDLSRKYGVGVRSLAKWNGMAPTDPLRPGQKLVVWTQKPVTVSSPKATPARSEMIRQVGYRVRSGDSLARIASKFNVTVKQIVSWNDIDPKKYLQPGQRLKLYVDITKVN